MRIAVVSGGTKGIGRAISEKLLQNGCKVYVIARTNDNEFTHENLIQYTADFSLKSGIASFTEFLFSHESVVDILVNNVGVTYHLTRHTFDAIKKSDKPYIFNICSTASITPYLNGGSYCVSKYAQLGFTKVLREELKEEGIKVSAVLPGATLTNSWAGTDLPKERFSDPESIADLVWLAYQLPDTTVMEEIILRPLSGDI